LLLKKEQFIYHLLTQLNRSNAILPQGVLDIFQEVGGLLVGQVGQIALRNTADCLLGKTVIIRI